jgi:adenosylmethionine-8-amino-7-oxononanoate aminotransferase
MAQLQKYFVQQGVWIRPFGNLVYIMPPYIIDQQQLSQLTKAIFNALK